MNNFVEKFAFKTNYLENKILKQINNDKKQIWFLVLNYFFLNLIRNYF